MLKGNILELFVANLQKKTGLSDHPQIIILFIHILNNICGMAETVAALKGRSIADNTVHK